MISSYHFGEIRLISLKNMKYKKINTGSQLIPESLFYEESFVSCAMLTLSDFIEVCLSLKFVFHQEIQIMALYYIFYNDNYEARTKPQ